MVSKENFNIYEAIKKLILECLVKYLKMSKPKNSTSSSMADCITALILSGIIDHWKNCISDLIDECMKGNKVLCFIVLRALADIDLLIHYSKTEEDNYSSPINIQTVDKMKIEQKLIDNNQKVKKFIIDIDNIIKTFSENDEYKNDFISAIFDSIRCWSNFELNIFKNIELANIVIFMMDNYQIQKPQNLSDLIMECITKSQNSKIYRDINLDEKEAPEQLSQRILEKIDKEEKIILDLLLKSLFPKLQIFQNIKLNETSEEKRKLLISYLRIFESIIENYIYLFFNFEDDKSRQMLEFFKYFLKYKKRKISYLFIEGMGEMRTFINNFYRFSGLNKGQKSEFINYFMNIFYGVLENCAYSNLPINNLSYLDNEIVNKFNSLVLNRDNQNFTFENKTDIEEYDSEFIEEMMTVESYRNYAGEVFYNIFFIFLENFGDENSAYILEKKIVSRIYDKNILNDPRYPLILDVILFSLCSLSEVFDIKYPMKCWNVIKNVINDYLSAQIVVQNQGIFIDILILIYKYYNFIAKDKDIFWKAMKFLLDASKNINNEKIETNCYIILSNLCSEKNENIQDDFNLIKELFYLFNEKYQKYNLYKIAPLQNIIESIFNLIGIKCSNSNKDISQDNLQFYSKMISELSSLMNNKIKDLLDKYILNSNNKGIEELLISEIVKCYNIQEIILSKLEAFNKEIKNYFINEYLNNYLFLTEKIMNIFYNNDKLMNDIFEFYTKISKAFEINSQKSIEYINKLFINFFIEEKGANSYKSILILKELYESLFKSAEKNNNLYIECNKYIIEYFYIIIKNFMEKIKKIQKLDKNIKEKLKVLFDFVISVFPKLMLDSQNQNIIKLMEELINFLINCFQLMQKLENEGELNEEYIIYNLIKTFNIIFSNKSFVQNDNDIGIYLNNSIIELWKTNDFKQFNTTSRSNLVNFYVTALSLDVNNFCNIFVKLIENKFDKKYIQAIVEYLNVFKDKTFNCKKMITTVIQIIKGNEKLIQLDFLQTHTVKEKLKNKK